MAQGVRKSLHGMRGVNSGVAKLTQQANNKHYDFYHISILWFSIPPTKSAGGYLTSGTTASKTHIAQDENCSEC
jgi:hypothetical protein